MKATGIVRRVDDLGRIVIPKEIRRPVAENIDSRGSVLMGNEAVSYAVCRTLTEPIISKTNSPAGCAFHAHPQDCLGFRSM